jgi:PAS domain S-box-containing protein
MKEHSEMITKSNVKPSQRLTIGLLIYGAEDPTCRELWGGVNAVAREHDLNLFSFRAEPLHIPDTYLSQANVLYELPSPEQLDGLVIWGGILAHYVSQEEVMQLLERYAGIPLVNVSSHLPDVPNVIIDNYRGTYDAATHLLEVHNREQPAFVRGPAGHVEAEARYRGYRDALHDHGIDVDPAYVVPGDFARGTGLESMRVLIEERRVPFDAVVAANDQLAMDVLEALQDRGMHVPHDVAVTGFDNRPEVRFTTPPLTSIDQPWAEMGRRAAELLVRRLEGDEALPEVVEVPPHLVVRESCGCVAKSVERVISPTLPKISADAASEFQLSEETSAAVVLAMQQAAPVLSERFDDDIFDELLKDFAADVGALSGDAFTARLDEVLRVSAAKRVEIVRWHDVMSAMRRELLGTLASMEPLVHAENLWQQARVMIGDWAARIQADRRFEERREQILLAEIGQTLSTSLEVNELMERITEALGRLAIPRCYLSLYENPSAPATWARMVLAYAEGQNILSGGGTRFASQQLVPPALLPSQRFSLHIEPLFFRERQLGFVVFEAQPDRGEVYDLLQRDISGALYGSRLLEQAERRAARIQTAAEVAQVAGTLLNTETLIDRVVDLVRAQFDLYYVGLFLVDDAAEWAVLQAGTGDAGREMIAREHKLRVGGDSMIGQCVAKQEARIALDVGEEAVRFDNPWLPETRSEMALPLVSRGEAIGALTIQSTEAAAFGAMDITTLQLMADQLANAVANARLYEQAQREIAERRETEQALAHQQYLLNVLLENTLDHIFFKDEEGRFIEVSRALMDWFGVEDREQIIGKTDFDFFADEHAQPAFEDEQRVMRTGEPMIEKEEKEVWADGREFWVSTSKLPMRDPEGNIVGVFGVSRDITPLKRAMNALERRSNQLQIASEVAQTVTGILDVDVLLQRVVDLVQSRFDLYHAGLFLIEERGEWAHQPGRWAVLRGSTGTAGQRMLEEGFQVAVDDSSLIGACILTGEPYIVADVNADDKSLDHPLLPETRSEMALPLFSRGEPIGVLTVHAKHANTFADEDVLAFQTMAGQIATAIENARLLEQTQTALSEMETTQRRYIQQAWGEYLQSQQQVSYTSQRSEEIVDDEALQAAIQKAVSRQEVVLVNQNGRDGESPEDILVIPALVRGQPIGAVALKSPGEGWTTNQIAMAQLLTERMALTAENLRLFEETQRVAARERLLGEVAAHVGERLDVESVLRTAADEIYEALNLEEVTVRLVDSTEFDES